MRFVIVTGMSLVPKLTELLSMPNSSVDKVALGMDIRSRYGAGDLGEALDQLDEMNVAYEVLFLDAKDNVLIKRYKETRRSHPLSGTGRVDQGIAEERRLLVPLRKRADYILDTSRLLIRDLKREITSIFVEDKQYKNLYITVLSFGFKYGIPSDADLVFDVRFRPNPYYIEELRPKNGNDKEVQD